MSLGASWSAWRQSVHNCTAPTHDGHIDEQRFWRASTIQQHR
ncbi:MAG: hypothetical protein ABF811_07920 [Pseudoclavibacter sp.]